jgi:hypothetical protein
MADPPESDGEADLDDLLIQTTADHRRGRVIGYRTIKVLGPDSQNLTRLLFYLRFLSQLLIQLSQWLIRFK